MAFAQTVQPFETHPDHFFQQAKDLLNNMGRDDAKALAQEFEVNWPKFSQATQQEIIGVANQMQQRKMLPYPYYYKYFLTINAFPGSQLPASTFSDWVDMVTKIIPSQKQGSNKVYEDYLEFSYALFAKNAVYSSESKTWACTSKDFDLKYENSIPSVVFAETDLYAYVPGDTIMIKNTGGVYYPFETKWVGKKGETDFTRGGLDADNVFCKLGNYTVDCSKNEYTADSAMLTYQPFIKTPMKGVFTDKLITNNEPATSTYPRFTSYDRIVKIENLAPNVKYVGGIALEGGKINGSGTPDEKARFRIYRYDGQLGCEVSSTEFTIRKFDDIYSNNAEVKLYLGKDSIYQPGCIFKYRMSTKDLVVQRGEMGVSKAAFLDTYHNHEIYAEAINWNVDEPYMDFKNIVASESTPAFFESINYYDENRMDKFQNVAEYNIITKLKQYKEMYDTFKVSTESLAKFIHPQYVPETIRRTLYKLVEDGFVYYDEANEIVTIRRKAIQYVLYKDKKIDYDIIKINSLNRDFNAKVDLKNNYNMGIKGVKNVKLSDSSYVIIFPRKDSLAVLKNRDMNFDGMFFAGRADLYGENFAFSYDGFNIALKNADTLLLNIPNGLLDSYGQPVLVPIKSTIENVTGLVQVDGKTNKSGVKNYKHMFPVLTASENSYVYYDSKKIMNGVYDRKKFFFEVKPFELDSLNSFRPAEIEFPGKLVTAGIFPEMEGVIGIQKDLFLGMITDRKDVALYGGKGKYSNKISLDGRGLRGDGDITFLASLSKSNDIVFFPDSLNANAQSFSQPKGPFNGVPFPRVENDSTYVHWVPKADSMSVISKSKPFSIFDNGSTLTGSIVLRSVGMRGSGIVDWSEATLKSNDIAFGANSMKADSSEFIIKSIDPTKFALRSTDIQSNVDFDKQEGNFKANDEDIATVLPYNQYMTTINSFKWDMAQKKIHFKGSKGADAEFTSIHPNQDSLKFNGSSATYDLNTYILDVHGVPYISVIDAHIFPDSGKVVIEADAKMRQLKNARIVADTINEYHRFYNATVDIVGKQGYKASADYDFQSATGPKQKLHFDEVSSWLDTMRVLRTKAVTYVDTSMHFTLIPKVEFQGRVRITGNNMPLEFEGFAKVQVQNPNVVVDWFSINNLFTNDSQYVHFTDPYNKGRRNVTSGIVFYSDSSDLYTSFFNAKRSLKDKNIFTANGILYYDEKTKEFIAGDPEKVINEGKRGNIIKYNDATGKVYAEGKMDMGLNFGLVDAQAAGTITTDFKKNEYRTDLLMGLQFDLDKDLLEMLGKSVLNSNFNMEDIDFFSEEFQRSIPEFIDPAKDKSFVEQMNKEGTFKRPSDSKFTIFFTDLKMVWDKETRSFRSTGPIGIAYIGNTAVNRLLDGAYLEIGYKKTGDFMNLYIPADDDNWYYFFYQNNNMQIVTDNKAFMTKLTDIDPDKRRTKTEDGKIYQYNTGSENRKNTFVTRMELLQEPQK